MNRAHNKHKVLRHYIGHSAFEYAHEQTIARLQTGLVMTTFLSISLGLMIYRHTHQEELISPLPVQASEGVAEEITVAGQLVEPTPSTLPQTTEKQQILNYIVEKFGDRSDAAIAMIYKCENSTFDQTRVNTNNNGTQDFGIFQINSIHEKRYGGAFKTDWKANVDVAFEIYKSAGNSFRPWTCAGIANEKNYLGQ